MTGPALGVVLAGGGTGGHIHPNLAVAERLEAIAPGRCRFVFVVSDRAIDQRVLEPERLAGEPVERVVSPAAPVILRPRKLARFVWSWGGGVRAGRAAVKRLAACDRVAMLATGGFVSAPAIVGARAERVERWVVNLDAVPGKANRLAARAATRVYQVGQADDTPAARALAPIIRDRFRSPPPAAEARQAFGLAPDRPTLLITGGSQGAGSVNGFVAAAARRIVHESGDAVAGWQVIHQCGQGDGAEAAAAAAWSSLGLPATVMSYVDRMDLAWAAADAAVCRGGAGTIADLWASQTPAIVLPYPYHRDGHQRLNAGGLADAGCVTIAEDTIDPDRNAEAHTGSLRALLDPQSRGRMAAGYARLGPADGADRLARDLLALG
ncbi:MAG: glycosyltransferase [Planctomycetota bacterium]